MSPVSRARFIRPALSAVCVALLVVSAAQAQTALPTFPSAADTDPVKLGWMQGSPPPADKIVRFADGSVYQFPKTRWSFAHFRQLGPTTQVSRGLGAPVPLPRAERDDLDALSFTPLGRQGSMTWADSLGANYTDGIVVLHKGRVIYERYLGALKPEGQHIAMSVTKSFFGLLGGTLVAEGKLDENAKIAQYVPELKDSAFGDATVRQVLDMRTGLKYSENYADPQAEIWNHVRAGGVLPRLVDWLDVEDFRRVFIDKAPMQALLADIPVRLLVEPDAALTGMAALAQAPGTYAIDYATRAWRPVG